MSGASKGSKTAKQRSKKGRIEEPKARAPEEADVPAARDEEVAEEVADAGEEKAAAFAPAKEGETPYRGSSPGGRAKGKRATVWQRATYRWTAITVVLAALLVLYSYHPYYKNQQFTPFKTVFPPAFVLWLGFGLLYVKATAREVLRAANTMRDSGLHLVALGKAAFEDVLTRGQWYAVSLFAGSAALLGGARALTPKTDVWHGGYASAAITSAVSSPRFLLARGLRPKRVWRLVRNRRVRTTLLAICVKAFFTPLMTGFVVGHLNGISRAWLNHKQLSPMDFKVPSDGGIGVALSMWWKNVSMRLADLIPSLRILRLVQPWAWTRADVSWGLGITYDIIFAVDCGWALFGYASESRWLGNKTRSVEPTAFGWLVCLACYPPFNNVLGTYLPLENGAKLFDSENAQLVLRGAVVFLFAISLRGRHGVVRVQVLEPHEPRHRLARPVPLRAPPRVPLQVLGVVARARPHDDADQGVLPHAPVRRVCAPRVDGGAPPRHLRVPRIQEEDPVGPLPRHLLMTAHRRAGRAGLREPFHPGTSRERPGRATTHRMSKSERDDASDVAAVVSAAATEPRRVEMRSAP